MRIGVIADTHIPRGSRRLPEACVERLRQADLILHAGDLTSSSFLAELRTLGPPVEAVRGNIDGADVAALLPETVVVEREGQRIGMIHVAGPRDGRERRLVGLFPGCAAVVYGHTHLPQVDRVGGVWILNPGSPTERRRAPARTMIELSVRRGELVPELVELGA